MANFKDNLVNRILGHTTRILGEKIKYTFKKGGDVQIDAIFDQEWEQVDPDTEQVVSTNQPVLGVRLSDLKDEPKIGDEILILRDNKKYVVQDTREDGQGGVSLFLRLQTRKTKTSRQGLLR